MHHCIALIWFHPVVCPLLSVQNGRGHYTERCICKLKSSKLLLYFNCNCNMFQVSEMGYLSIAAQNVFSCHDQRSKQAKSETRKIQNPKHPQINSIKIQNLPPNQKPEKFQNPKHPLFKVREGEEEGLYSWRPANYSSFWGRSVIFIGILIFWQK